LGWSENEFVEREIKKRDDGIIVSSHIILRYLNLKREYSKNILVYKQKKTKGGGFLSKLIRFGG